MASNNGNMPEVHDRIKRLLRESEIDLIPSQGEEYLRDRVALVTGAGGSIGSELCRQICRSRPRKLVLLGRGEYSIYQIYHELAATYGNKDIECVIGDMGNSTKMDFLFRDHKPDIVFHAAAHKFISFVEQYPEEGVLNNIFGTWTVAQIARQYGVDKFVFISTDKAVHATSVLGATKKLTELLVQDLADSGTTEFISVRFGNVLRSRGSVVPLFEKQIASGGPVTVTHAKAERYFMSIHEAAHLVLGSGIVGGNGSLCVLDMGERIRILELVEVLIQLSGYKPYGEIDIEFTGLGPGEKLVEEMLTEGETAKMRRSGQILITRSERGSRRFKAEDLERLRKSALACCRIEVIQLLMDIVPGYKPEIVANF